MHKYKFCFVNAVFYVAGCVLFFTFFTNVINSEGFDFMK